MTAVRKAAFLATALLAGTGLVPLTGAGAPKLPVAPCAVTGYAQPTGQNPAVALKRLETMPLNKSEGTTLDGAGTWRVPGGQRSFLVVDAIERTGDPIIYSYRVGLFGMSFAAGVSDKPDHQVWEAGGAPPGWLTALSRRVQVKGHGGTCTVDLVVAESGSPFTSVPVLIAMLIAVVAALLAATTGTRSRGGWARRAAAAAPLGLLAGLTGAFVWHEAGLIPPLSPAFWAGPIVGVALAALLPLTRRTIKPAPAVSDAETADPDATSPQATSAEATDPEGASAETTSPEATGREGVDAPATPPTETIDHPAPPDETAKQPDHPAPSDHPAAPDETAEQPDHPAPPDHPAAPDETAEQPEHTPPATDTTAGGGSIRRPRRWVPAAAAGVVLALAAGGLAYGHVPANPGDIVSPRAARVVMLRVWAEAMNGTFDRVARPAMDTMSQLSGQSTTQELADVKVGVPRGQRTYPAFFVATANAVLLRTRVHVYLQFVRRSADAGWMLDLARYHIPDASKLPKPDIDPQGWLRPLGTPGIAPASLSGRYTEWARRTAKASKPTPDATLTAGAYIQKSYLARVAELAGVDRGVFFHTFAFRSSTAPPFPLVPLVGGSVLVTFEASSTQTLTNRPKPVPGPCLRGNKNTTVNFQIDGFPKGVYRQVAADFTVQVLGTVPAAPNNTGPVLIDDTVWIPANPQMIGC